jgi:thiamine biosynthesis lipoprotein
MALGVGSVRVEEIWGTAIGVDVRDRLPARTLDDVFAWFLRVDQLFSTWRDDSEICRLARQELRLDDTSAEVRDVLSLCDAVKNRSRGAFDVSFAADPRVEPRPGLAAIDPSGLVKGWALERAAEIICAVGGHNFAINAGGDVLIRGHPAPGAKWRVGIQHPWLRTSVAEVVEGTDLAVATSGRYERGEHIVSPFTGSHPAGLMSVTVVGSDLALADGYATAAVVLGREGMDWITTVPDVDALGITDDQQVITTEGFDRFRVR